MHCPYCTSEVPQAAIVCPHCTRDFYLFKPLLERIEQLEKRFSEQAQPGSGTCEAKIAALENELAALKAAQPAVPVAGAPVNRAGAAPLAPNENRRYGVSLILALSQALALLLAAHILLLFVYDVKPIYLRFASMLIPIPFGFALLVWHPRRFRPSAIGGFVMAAAAISLMLATTAYVDNVPVLPQGAREIREVLEYMASIGLAFLTGLLLGKLRNRRLHVSHEPNRLAVILAQLFTTNHEGELGVVRLAFRIQKMVSAFMPIWAGAASVYAGIKALLDA